MCVKMYFSIGYFRMAEAEKHGEACLQPNINLVTAVGGRARQGTTNGKPLTHSHRWAVRGERRKKKPHKYQGCFGPSEKHV